MSVEKEGYTKKEFNYALEVFDKFPKSEIFVIPVRLDNCKIPYEKLNDYEHIDLFPNWGEGKKRILQAMKVPTPETYKNLRTAMLLSIIPGIGHIYIGKKVKGILILIIEFFFSVYIFSSLVSPSLIGPLALIGFWAIWIWQIFNLRKLAKQVL